MVPVNKETDDALDSPSNKASADKLVFPEPYPDPYPDAEAATEAASIEDQDGERESECSRALVSSLRSSSWDSSDDSEMMVGSLENAGPARGEERHGRECITPLGGAHDVVTRGVRP